MPEYNDPLNGLVEEVLEKEIKERKALRLLLDKELEKKNYLLVQKSQMGGTESFLGAVTLEWFASRVRLASQLPLFNEKKDPITGRIIIDEETIDIIKQRPLNWERRLPLALYLTIIRNHKFPPVLVVLSKDWVDNPRADEWAGGGKSIKSVSDFTPLDNEGRVGLLNISEELGVTIYALDGQHRLLGAAGLMELISTGELKKYNQDGKEIGKATMKDICEEYNLEASHIQSLGKEKIGIEFISAVVPDETHEEARQRVRSIFVHVNRMAVGLTKGEIAQLEEDNGFAIIAKWAATEHELLKHKPLRDNRVEMSDTNLKKKSKELTTLQTLKTMATEYLNLKYDNWKPRHKNLVELRPDPEQLSAGKSEFFSFLDKLSTLPCFQNIEAGASIIHMRSLARDKTPGNAHMLFRPIGQEALAAAIGELVYARLIPLDIIINKLIEYDRNNKFKLDSPSSIWYGVIYDFHKGKINMGGKKLAIDILKYLLGGGIQDDAVRENLRQEVAKVRYSTETLSINYDGNVIPKENLMLPPVL